MSAGRSVAAIGDIHANAPALSAALDAARDSGAAEIVLLGDLLTFGAHVGETVSLVADAVAGGARLILGNHDQMYLDLLAGSSPYFDTLAGWIAESVEMTLDRLDARAFAELPFEAEHATDGILFSHANPFGGGDWEYLNSADQLERARAALRQRGFDAGVFGHTHRAMLDPEGSPRVLNPGSVGQPRSQERACTFLLLERHAGGIAASVEVVDYDLDEHLAAIRGCGLSADTTAKLLSYF